MTVHLVAHLQNRTSHYTSQILQKSHQANAPRQKKNDNKLTREKEGRRHNRRLAQWRVMWLIENSTSHQLFWCIDSFVLRNPPLRQAPKR
jgi:hypothetical protein